MSLHGGSWGNLLLPSVHIRGWWTHLKAQGQGSLLWFMEVHLLSSEGVEGWLGGPIARDVLCWPFANFFDGSVRMLVYYKLILLIFLLKGECICCCLVAKLCLTLAILWTVALQAPLSMGFLMQEYWSRLPLLSPGDLPNPGIKFASLVSSALAGRFFTIEGLPWWLCG